MSSTPSETTPDTTTEKEYEELKQTLHCPVCLELFKKPISMLPCLHSFCSPCLKASSSTPPLSSSSSSSPCSPRCPVCRQEFSPEPGQKNSPKINDYFHDQLDHLERLGASIGQASGVFLGDLDIDHCELCDDPSSSFPAFFCAECKAGLCEECHHFHSEIMSQHKVVSIIEADAHIISSFYGASSDKKCSSHPDETLNKFCHQCQISTCYVCHLVGSHVDHENSDLSVVMDQHRKNLSSLTDEVEARRDDLIKTVSLVLSNELKIQEKLVEHICMIEETFLDYQNRFRDAETLIEQRKQKHIQSATAKSEIKLNKLAEKRKQLDSDLDCLDNSISLSRSLIKRATDSQFESHSSSLTDQLIRLKNDPSFAQIPKEIEKENRKEERHKQQIDSSDFLLDYHLLQFHQASLLPRTNKQTRWPITAFGEKGTGKYQFDRPTAICFDENDNLIVCDSNNHRALVFDKTFDFVHSTGSWGSLVGQFFYLRGAAAQNRSIVFCDESNNRLHIFENNPDGLVVQAIIKIGSTLQDGANGVAFDADDRLYVCMTSSNRIKVYDKHGSLLKTIGSSGQADGQFSQPEAVAIDNFQRMIVCDTRNHRIQIFDDQGVFVSSFGSHGKGPGQFRFPYGVAVDHHNRIIVCDSGNNRIQVFHHTGKFIGSFGSLGSEYGMLNGPVGVAINRDNCIVVCDTGNNRIQVFQSF